MKLKIAFGVFFIVLTLTNLSYSDDAMLPYQGGSTWKCSQGTYEDPDNQYWNEQEQKWKESFTNPTHNSSYSSGKLKYAIDFGLPMRTPVIASRSGPVTSIGTGYNGGWGNCPLITYGNGRIGRYAHMDEVIVEDGEYVRQGQVIGYSGNTGNSDGPHLHYQEEDSNGQSLPLTFIDAEEADRVPKRWVPEEEKPDGLRHVYTSLNTYNSDPNSSYRIGKFANGWKIEQTNVCYKQFVPFSRPFAVTYYHKNKDGQPVIGAPINEVHKNIENVFFECLWEDPVTVWIQDAQGTNGDGKTYTLVLNPYVFNIRFNYLGVVYTLEGPIRNYWFDHYC
ncbi:MAG: M23 family metallopeptidase, partial [Patescibacteria group bacterium]